MFSAAADGHAAAPGESLSVASNLRLFGRSYPKNLLRLFFFASKIIFYF